MGSVEGYLAHFGYVAIFAALTAGGLGVPVPEELTQLTAGALAHEGILDLRLAIPVVWLGILVGDTILFALARRHGPRLLDTRAARRVLTPARRERVEAHLRRHAFWTVVVARHAGGVRFPVFAMAGASGVRTATFVLADALSALVSVPLVVGAGWLFWDHLSQARRDVRLVEIVLLAVLAVGIAIVVLVRRRRSRAAACARR
jgi:membrane protein DedA with SNARE-associated domain